MAIPMSPRAIIITILAVIIVFAFLRARRRRVEFPLVFRIMKWLILLAAYFGILAFGAPLSRSLLGLANGLSLAQFNQAVSTTLHSPNYVLPLLVIAGWMVVISYIYLYDQAREQTTSDDFKGDTLLLRYGTRVHKITLPIYVKPEWTDQEINRFVDAMQERIGSQTESRFSTLGVQVTYSVLIQDRDLPFDNRSFLKIIFRSRRGSQVSHFIYYAMAGKMVVAHYLSHIRGMHLWQDVVDFVVTSPLSIWFWGMRWLQNQYSIVAAISRDLSNNSYDWLDLETYFLASELVLLDETERFLEEQGLLTSELKQMIFNNINNSQNISITGSQDVKLDNVRNIAHIPLPAPQPSNSGD